MGSEILAAVLALIGFVLTQGFLKFVLEPIQEQRRVIGEIAHLSAVLDIPEFREDVDKEELEASKAETRKNLRDLAGRLWASLWAIPLYDLFALLGLVPKAERVKTAAVSLSVWSYFMITTKDVNEFQESRDYVAGLLGIRHTLPIAFEHDPNAGVPINPKPRATRLRLCRLCSYVYSDGLLLACVHKKTYSITLGHIPRCGPVESTRVTNLCYRATRQ